MNKTLVEPSVKNFDESVESLLGPVIEVNKLIKLVKVGNQATKLSLFSPLLASASRGYLKSTELLLRAGADVNLPNSDGHMALMKVCLSKKYFQSGEDGVDYFGCTKTLLCFGAKINITFNIGYSRSKSALQFLITTPTLKVRNGICRLLYAAGETDTFRTAEDALATPDEKLELKHLCRVKIRKHLLRLDAHTNLFFRVPTLGLPCLLTDYLLYDMWSG